MCHEVVKKEVESRCDMSHTGRSVLARIWQDGHRAQRLRGSRKEVYRTVL